MSTDINNRALIGKRALTAGLGIGALALMAPRASADTPFSRFPFPATGAPTARTMPDRLAEIKNVKDFGAIGDGNRDDTKAIQAAVDWTSGANRGTIYFPPGTYKVTGSITFNVAGEFSIIFRGDGKASHITGNFNGFVLDRSAPDLGTGTRIVESLWIENSHPTGGALRLTETIGGTVRDCVLNANRALDISRTQSMTVQSCALGTNGNTLGSYGIIIGENANVINCDITGFDTGITLSGVGPNILGCRLEVNGTAIKVGFDPISPVNPANFCAGFSIIGGSFESNGTAVDFYGGCGYGLVSSFTAQAFPSLTPYDRTVVSSTTITGSVSGATGTGSISSAGILTISGVTGTFQPGMDYIAGTGVPSGTKTYSQTSGRPGKDGTYTLTGSPAYGLRVRSGTHDTVFSALGIGGANYVASIHIENTPHRGNNVFIGVNGQNSGVFGGQAWSLPTMAHVADFIGCNRVPRYTFAGLPKGADSEGQPNVREGDQYYITDANTSTLGANVTAGGPPNTRGYVTWNGSNWTLTSK